MKPLFLLAVMLALPPAVSAADASAAIQADWRRDGVDERVKAALAGRGWRFEDDGRALDPRTKSPAPKAVLDRAVLDLRLGARRAALEAVNLMLASGKPLEFADAQRVKTLAADLPPALTAALLDPKSDARTVKALADADLSRVAAYFDGGRTMADRQAAAQPVSAGTPRPRTDSPYHTDQEKSVSEKMRASAEAAIGRHPFGKTVLSRLNGENGKPELPPIIIEDLGGSAVARYDFRRRAVALDSEIVLASVIGASPPAQASALRASLSARAALAAHLAAHPEAVDAVVQDNDVVLVHELTHAWQDRRDPVFREIARGNLPDAQPLEYEEEAYIAKNLYIRSKMKNDPASVKMDAEFADFSMMLHGPNAWRASLADLLRESSPSRALPLQSVEAIQAARLAKTRSRAEAAPEDRKAKALDLAGMELGQRELRALAAAHKARMAPIAAELDKASAGRAGLLGGFYLIQAQRAARRTDRTAFLDQAERYALASRDAALLEKIRGARRN